MIVGGGSGGGRRAALQVLDSLLSEEHNLRKLRDALQERFDMDPVGFFTKLVMPLLPQESKGGTDLNNVAANLQQLATAMDAVTFPSSASPVA